LKLREVERDFHAHDKWIKCRSHEKTVGTGSCHLSILDWPAEAAKDYAEIRAYLQKKGKMIGSNDLLIAAHARYLRAILVTNNEDEFRRVPGLKIDNWC
jgi:hypothetical protein